MKTSGIKSSSFFLLIVFSTCCFCLDVTVTPQYVNKGTHEESIIQVKWSLSTPQDDIYRYSVAWGASDSESAGTYDLYPTDPSILTYSYQIDNIMQGDCYNVIVYAYSSSGQIQRSENILVQSYSPVPHGLTFDVNNGDATVTWQITGRFRVDSYTIYLFHSSSFETLGHYQPVTNTSPMTYTMTLLKGVHYNHMAVYSNVYTSCGQSWQQKPGQMAIDHLTAPETPINVKASTPESSNDPTSELHVTWEMPISFPWTHYIVDVQAMLDPSDSHSYLESYGPETFAVGLKGNEEYRVTVTAINVYTGDDLAGDSSTPISALTVPNRIDLTFLYELISGSTGTGMVYVGFNKPDGGDAISHYEITWYSENNPSTIESSGIIEHVAGKSHYDYVTRSLDKGLVYYFSVNAFNSVGSSNGIYSIYI